MRGLVVGVLLAMGSTSAAIGAADDVHYACDLSDNDESAETYSPGKGRAEFTLERATMKLSWRVSYEGLTTPLVSAGAYGPERVGANAGETIRLSANGTTSPLTGSKALNDSERQYLATGRMYVNLLTAKYKDGELRCQIGRLREKPASAP